MPTWVQVLIAVIALVGTASSGAITRLVTAWLERRKTRSEAAATEAVTIEALMDKLSVEHGKRLNAEVETERLRKENVELQDIVRRFPMARTAEQLRGLNGLARFFDELSDAIAVSVTDGSAANIIYVNPSFSGLLSRSREDVLALHWTSQVHPDDLPKSRSQEGRATWQPVIGFRNRWRHADGSWVALQWDCGRYVEDMTFCRVRRIE